MTGCVPVQPTLRATEPPIAILTYLNGEVLHGEVLPSEVYVESPALPYQLLTNNTVVRTQASSKATVVCYNNHTYQVPEQSTFTATVQACGTAPAVPPEAVESISTNAVCRGGSCAAEGKWRAGDDQQYGQQPVIISPRGPELLTVTPQIVWVAVPGAVQYEVELSWGDQKAEVLITATDSQQLRCATAPTIATLQLCTVDWPLELGTLGIESTYSLLVRAYMATAGDQRTGEDVTLFLATAPVQQEIAAQIATVRALAVDEVTEQLLLGGLYAEAGFYDAAITAYTGVLARQPGPRIHVMLGEMYRKTGLLPMAQTEFEHVLDELASNQQPDLYMRAAAELGLGLVYASQKQVAAAETHLQTARQLYAELQMTDMAESVTAILLELHKSHFSRSLAYYHVSIVRSA